MVLLMVLVLLETRLCMILGAHLRRHLDGLALVCLSVQSGIISLIGTADTSQES